MERVTIDVADVPYSAADASVRMGDAIAALVDSMAPLNELAVRLATMLRVYHFGPEGYYERDGKWRRDHRYFRQRARDRRAALARARRSTAHRSC